MRVIHSGDYLPPASVVPTKSSPRVSCPGLVLVMPRRSRLFFAGHVSRVAVLMWAPATDKAAQIRKPFGFAGAIKFAK